MAHALIALQSFYFCIAQVVPPFFEEVVVVCVASVSEYDDTKRLTSNITWWPSPLPSIPPGLIVAFSPSLPLFMSPSLILFFLPFFLLLFSSLSPCLSLSLSLSPLSPLLSSPLSLPSPSHFLAFSCLALQILFSGWPRSQTGTGNWNRKKLIVRTKSRTGTSGNHLNFQESKPEPCLSLSLYLLRSVSLSIPADRRGEKYFKFRERSAHELVLSGKRGA